jgi:acyl-CoA synthetase (AMP-forming)/AMP-acid ligase II
VSAAALALDPRQEAERLRLWDQPRARDLVELVAGPAGWAPDVAAAHFCHHGAEPESITWGSLWQRANGVAHRLIADGMQPGDRVVIIVPTSKAYLEAFFGVQIARGIAVPLAPPTALSGSKRDNYAAFAGVVISDCQAWGAILQPVALDALAPLLAVSHPELRLIGAGDWTPEAEAPSRPDVRRDGTAMLQYTSGSTSQPKGVMLSHTNIVENLEAIAEKIASPELVGVTWLPLYHDMGLIGTCLTPLYSRRPITLMPPQAFAKDPAVWLRAISDYGATASVAPNFAFSYCTGKLRVEDLAGVRLDTLRTLLNGAEPVDMDAVKTFEQKFGPLGLKPGTVRPVYGLAESALAVTFTEPGVHRVDEVDSDRVEIEGVAAPPAPESRVRRFVSVGHPISGQTVRIGGVHDEALPDREIGHVLVQGPSIMQGYYGRPDETESALRNGWLHTGDLGYLADGELYITGRIKDLIIRHGRNYAARDIEAKVAAVEGVLYTGAVAFSLEGEGETKVIIVVETRLRDAAARQALVREIRLRCHDAFLFGPDDVKLVSPGSIPRTTSGKLRRQETRRRFLDGEFEALN